MFHVFVSSFLVYKPGVSIPLWCLEAEFDKSQLIFDKYYFQVERPAPLGFVFCNNLLLLELGGLSLTFENLREIAGSGKKQRVDRTSHSREGGGEWLEKQRKTMIDGNLSNCFRLPRHGHLAFSPLTGDHHHCLETQAGEIMNLPFPS